MDPTDQITLTCLCKSVAVKAVGLAALCRQAVETVHQLVGVVSSSVVVESAVLLVLMQIKFAASMDGDGTTITATNQAVYGL